MSKQRPDAPGTRFWLWVTAINLLVVLVLVWVAH